MTLIYPPKFICNACEREFETSRALSRHQEKEEHYLEGRTVREGLAIPPPAARFPDA